MPDDAKSIICEVVHEVCKCILENTVLCPHSPFTPIPVPPPVENPHPTTSEDITPGLRTMSLSMMAALSVLQETATVNEPSHQLHRSQRRHSSESTCQTCIARTSTPSPPKCSMHNHNCSTSSMPSTASRVTIVTTDLDNNFICRNCFNPGHHHKHCPCYHCHVCCVYARS
jgi:hypothetical protein